MILTYDQIRDAYASEELGLTPFDSTQLQPASYDVRLGDTFSWFKKAGNSFFAPGMYTSQSGLSRGKHVLDPKVDCSEFMETVTVDKDYEGKMEPCIEIDPGMFMLAATRERLRLPADMVAQLSGKSSLARRGLQVHMTAGFVDPGWDGVLTLELYNCSPMPVRLYPGMLVGQLAFVRLSQPTSHPYGHPDLGSKYQGASDMQSSQMHLNY